MSMQVQCPGCQSKFKLKEAPDKPKKMRCPKCKDIITVNPPGDEDLEEAAATAPKAKARGARKAPAKAGKKSAAAGKRGPAKKKAKSAAADDWDLDGFDDDFEGGDDDGFDDDDFESPSPTRRRKSSGKGGKAPAKGKGAAKAKGKKGKKAAAESGGGKGKTILFVVIGLLVVGGIGGGIWAFSGGGDDSPETTSTEGSGDGGSTPASAAGNPDQGGGDQGQAGGGEPVVADAAPADAAGQNVFDLKYIPANTDLLIRLKVGDVWNAPLLADLIGQIPPGAMDASPVKPQDFEHITIGVHLEPSAIPQPGQPPSPEALNNLQKHIAVAKLTRAITAEDMPGIFVSSQEYNGATIHEVPTDPQSPQPPEFVWFAESQMIVGGSLDAVKSAIDSKGREARMERFDFVDQSSQLVFAFATDDVAGFEALQQQQQQQTMPIPIPGLEQFSSLMEENTIGGGIGLNVYNDIRLSLQVACKDSSGANAVKDAMEKGIAEGVKQLEEQKKGNLLLGAIFDIGINMLKGGKPAVSGSNVSAVLALSEDDIKAIQNNPLLAGMLQSATSQLGNLGGGGPMGFAGLGGGGGTPFVEIEQTTIDFETDIQPIIRWRCRKCHVNESQGGFSLADHQTLMAHDSAKGKAVVPGDPDASTFYTTVSGGAPPHDLKGTEAERIRAWIKAGAQPPGQTVDINALPTAPRAPVNRPKPPPTGGGNGFGGFGGNSNAFGNGGSGGGTPLSYVKDIEPIMKKNCGRCHISQQKGRFSLASLQAFTNHSSGKRGRALNKGNSAQSSLYKVVQSGAMPPGSAKLGNQDIDLIKRWIDGGANP